jgi:hypothetical protein
MEQSSGYVHLETPDIYVEIPTVNVELCPGVSCISAMTNYPSPSANVRLLLIFFQQWVPVPLKRASGATHVFVINVCFPSMSLRQQWQKNRVSRLSTADEKLNGHHQNENKPDDVSFVLSYRIFAQR